MDTGKDAVPAAVLSLAGFLLLNIAASFCFKESGTNQVLKWHYLILGNIFGPLSLIFLMSAYARMNVGIAAAIAVCGSSVTVQIAFWQVYHTQLTSAQWAGIALATAGAALAVLADKPRTTPAAAGETA